VVKNIDAFLGSLDIKMTFLEYVKLSLKHKKEPINQFEYYTTAYLMLDMIGYKADKLPSLQTICKIFRQMENTPSMVHIVII
jgi:hypothetical protein